MGWNVVKVPVWLGRIWFGLGTDQDQSKPTCVVQTKAGVNFTIKNEIGSICIACEESCDYEQVSMSGT